MAAPFVAGLASLLAIEEPAINGFQIREVIFDTTNEVPTLHGKVSSSGRINALDSIQQVQAGNLSTFQPDFGSTTSRNVASSDAGAGAAGCGLIRSVWKNTPSGGGSGSGGGMGALVLGLLLVPVLFAISMRKKKKSEDGSYKRAHQRYKIDSQVKINVGGREIVGNVSSISLGGARVDTDAMLESGGIVTMAIASPDGSQQIQVQGRVVWSEEKKAYGVKFCDTKESTLAALGNLTKKLVKAS